MSGKDLLSICDLSREEIKLLLLNALNLKVRGWNDILERKTLALVFEKPSLRTRVSFEIAMKQLGGQSIYLSPAEVGLGKRETIADVARVLSRYVDAIAARTFEHGTVTALAQSARVPVINALSDVEHPCQALADLLTIYEKKGELPGLTIAYIGDGNNVANSLMLAAVLMGMHFRIASPVNYQIPESIMKIAEECAIDSECKIFATESPAEAVKGADVVYTDVWTSMGQEAEAEARRRIFADYKITQELLDQANEDAILMHPLPAHPGEELADGMVDSPQSVVFDQAENRLHLQKALLVKLLGGQGVNSYR